MIVLNSYLCSFHITLIAESDIFLDMHIKAGSCIKGRDNDNSDHRVITGFRRGVNEIYALLGSYAA